MIDLKNILLEICGDERSLDPNIDLFESGLLDSYAVIELFTRFEDLGIELYPTQVKREQLKNIMEIEKLLKDHLENK